MHFDGGINLSALIGFAALMATLLSMHRSNRKTVQDATLAAQRAAADMAEIKLQVGEMWRWWIRNKTNGT